MIPGTVVNETACKINVLIFKKVKFTFKNKQSEIKFEYLIQFSQFISSEENTLLKRRVIYS